MRIFADTKLFSVRKVLHATSTASTNFKFPPPPILIKMINHQIVLCFSLAFCLLAVGFVNAETKSEAKKEDARVNTWFKLSFLYFSII